ncbi:MAG TPA: hypothetical protein DIV86_02310 [Alphaproteobacteria bacterium]|nr:hypothetical protein [Alphaproteobacteria bacterium]
MRYIVIFCLLVIFTSTNSNAGNLYEKSVFERTDRDYLLYLPNVYASLGKREKLPLIIALHGGGWNNQTHMEMTGLNETAEKSGFAVAYPNGMGNIPSLRNWSSTQCCGANDGFANPDIGFIKKLISQVTKEYKIDPKRVFVSGHSNGGGRLAYELGCFLPTKIKAVAVNASPVADWLILNKCKNPKVPILHTHGAKDQCAPFFGLGMCGTCFASMFSFNNLQIAPALQNNICFNVPSAIETIVRNYHCKTSKKIDLAKNVQCNFISECDNNSTVGLCAFTNAGHTWAGGKYDGGEVCRQDKESSLCKKYFEILGKINKDVSLNDIIWGFFSGIR